MDGVSPSLPGWVPAAAGSSVVQADRASAPTASAARNGTVWRWMDMMVLLCMCSGEGSAGGGPFGDHVTDGRERGAVLLAGADDGFQEAEAPSATDGGGVEGEGVHPPIEVVDDEVEVVDPAPAHRRDVGRRGEDDRR